MYAFGWLADIGASSLWISECPTEVPNTKLLEKKYGPRRDGHGR